MKMQPDFFDNENGFDGVETPKVETAAPAPTLLAVPCGVLDRANERCRGLAHRSVVLSSAQLGCRGLPTLHCDPEC